MSRDVFPLPPKMLAKYAERARNGEASRVLGGGKNDPLCWYIFDEPVQEISICGLDSPVGHYRKVPRK